MLLLSDELISCCVADTNGCLDLRRRAFAPGGQVTAEWSGCPGSMARRARESVAPLRRSSAGWMPARIGRLSVDVRHNTGAQYSVIEWIRARAANRCVVAPALQPEPASRLRSAKRDVSFLRSDSKCQRYVSDLSNVTPRYLG